MSEKEILALEQLVRPTLPGMLYFLLLGVVILLAFVFGRYHEQSRSMLLAAINPRVKSTLERSDTESITQTGVFLNVIFFTNFLLLSWLAYQLPLWGGEYTLSFSLVVVGVLLLFGFKFAFQYLLGYVFKTQHEVKLYLQDTYLKYRLFGVIIFPIILLGFFSKAPSEPFILIAFGVFVLLYIAHSLFGIRVGLMSKSFPKHYAILYICTLEILPLLLVLKLFWLPIKRLMGF